jgi:Family of unknown function (DUF5327)
VIYLNISVEKVIQQIENELHKAKGSTHNIGQFRERIASIRSLCELLLEEEGRQEVTNTNILISSYIAQPIQSRPVISQPSIKSDVEDTEQVGSLLDF